MRATALAALWPSMPMACIAGGMCGPGRASNGWLRCLPIAETPSSRSATSAAWRSAPAATRPRISFRASRLARISVRRLAAAAAGIGASVRASSAACRLPASTVSKQKRTVFIR